MKNGRNRRGTPWIRFALAGAVILSLAGGAWLALKTGSERLFWTRRPSPAPSASFTGSGSCRSCHEKFYSLWSTSFHGLAMQPFTEQFVQTGIASQSADIKVGNARYRAEITGQSGWVVETGPAGAKKYPMKHVLGGKNVCYFLTPMEGGRLQTLPLAYDVRKKEWFDTAASGLRHFPGLSDEPLPWTDPRYTFNTSCHSCHVSQLATNYDLKTDTYNTTWAEPGINCETCHGPAAEHVRTFQDAPKGQIPKDLKLISQRKMSGEQRTANCAPCHAKMIPLTSTFQPGDRFFDHYDLTTFDDPDFYPDGRDLGENYTFTLWLTSPCVKSGKMDCLHCHTSSGRFRFKADQANNACAPCHQKHVSNSTAHSHHAAGSPGNSCISCHMPMTEFARMRRSDHSMRPPTPAATIAFKSPNACNLCHADKSPGWADQWVRKWRNRDYQAPVLHRAGLIQSARKADWKRLAEMLAYLESKDRDEIHAASLISLLRSCDDPRKWPLFIKLLQDSSPLVRARAADALGDHPAPESMRALLTAVQDDFRLVRIRAAAALAAVPPGTSGYQTTDALGRAISEYEASMKSRPDDFASHYNLGNYHMARGDPQTAVQEFEIALKLQPEMTAALVNSAMAYNLVGRNDRAEENLRRALALNPASEPANFNLGLLLGQMGRTAEAEAALRAALKANPKSAAAAYNLGVLLSKDRMEEALQWCRQAADQRPEEPKYSYTLAFYLHQAGRIDAAMAVLHRTVDRQQPYPPAYSLLAEIYQQKGRPDQAQAVYRQALRNEMLSESDKAQFAALLQALPNFRMPSK